jgi:hypothetical protein
VPRRPVHAVLVSVNDLSRPPIARCGSSDGSHRSDGRASAANSDFVGPTRAEEDATKTDLSRQGADAAAAL